MAKEVKQIEVFFTPDWHYSLSCFLGDINGEIGYITEYGTVHLLGKQNPDLSRYQIESKIEGPVKSITANNSLGVL